MTRIGDKPSNLDADGFICGCACGKKGNAVMILLTVQFDGHKG